MFRANYPVDNPSDYWKISLYFVFLETLDHLVEDVLERFFVFVFVFVFWEGASMTVQ